MKPTGRLKAAAVVVLLACGCTVGPRYSKPAVQAQIPPAYKEAATGPQDNLLAKAAVPSDQIPRGKWWQVFEDPQLNDLEEQIAVSNQNLRVAEAQFTQARALIQYNRAAYFPVVSAGAGVITYRESPNRPVTGGPTRYTDYTVPLDATWEPDVWGRVKRTVEGATASAQATAADLEVVNLSLHAELASDYFQLRGLDAEKELLDSTVTAYQRALDLTQNRFTGGIASEEDVAQAQTQLETVRAQAADVEEQRAILEHAIATLTGKSASTFTLASSPLKTPPPQIPAGVPSELLERRPDIAASERRMAAANAQLGVARAAYFPSFVLSLASGLEGGTLGTWFLPGSVLWAGGASAAETIFEGGQRRSVTAQNQAIYQQTIGTYQQTVLAAFQEVEDGLSSIHVLADEGAKQDAAVTAAEHSLEIATNRYKGGLDTYLDVITTQSIALTNERVAVELLSRRMVSTVALIKALGGGWKLSDLPAK